MEVPTNVLHKLLCNNCDGYLSRGPILLLQDGKSFCGRCLEPDDGAIRNSPYEELAKLLLFPCIYAEYGCQQNIPFEDNKIHEEACEYRVYLCPIADSGKCDWSGLRGSLLGHCRIVHPKNIIENAHKFIHNIASATIDNFLLAVFSMLFLVQTKVCTITRSIYHSVRLIGNPNHASIYEYVLVIENKKNKIIKHREVVPQGCLSLQEDSSIKTGINSLLGVLGEYQGTTFTLTIRVSEEVSKLSPVNKLCVKLTCIKCHCATEPIYQSEKGWKCKSCAPSRRPCRFIVKGCIYTDIGKKCGKHELYFCSYVVRCVICKKNIVHMPLKTHYSEVHEEILYKAGIEWTIKVSNEEQWSIISGDFGNALCQFWKDGNKFNLNIRTSLSSEQLYKYRCVVQISHPDKGYSLIRSPNVQYDTMNDWDVRILNEELRVCVYRGRCNIKVDFLNDKN